MLQTLFEAIIPQIHPAAKHRGTLRRTDINGVCLLIFYLMGKRLNILVISSKIELEKQAEGAFFLQDIHKKRTILTVLLVVAALALLLFLIGLDIWKGQKEAAFTQSGLSMGTVVTAQLYGPGEAETSSALFSAFDTLEKERISWRAESSEIAKINASAGSPAPISEQTAAYLRKAAEVSQKSDGALDCTVGTLTKLWDIGGDHARVPSPEEIAVALQTVGWQHFSLKDGQAKLASGQSLDLGAIGKGIACDEAKRLLDGTRLSGAVISVGGSILLWGSRPGGGDWKVGVRDPRGEAADQLGTFTLAEGFVSTSGDYERTLTVDGTIYHHILNPKTGYPADAGLISVTVTAPSGLLSDALSTACFILGYEKSLPLLDAFGAEAIFVTQEKQVRITPGLKQTFQLTNDAYHLIQDT